MGVAIAFGIWLAFAILTGITARYVAVKIAERKGWTAITMPPVYFMWIFGVYILLEGSAWFILYNIFVK